MLRDLDVSLSVLSRLAGEDIGKYADNLKSDAEKIVNEIKHRCSELTNKFHSVAERSMELHKDVDKTKEELGALALEPSTDDNYRKLILDAFKESSFFASELIGLYSKASIFALDVEVDSLRLFEQIQQPIYQIAKIFKKRTGSKNIYYTGSVLLGLASMVPGYGAGASLVDIADTTRNWAKEKKSLQKAINTVILLISLEAIIRHMQGGGLAVIGDFLKNHNERAKDMASFVEDFNNFYEERLPAWKKLISKNADNT